MKIAHQIKILGLIVALVMLGGNTVAFIVDYAPYMQFLAQYLAPDKSIHSNLSVFFRIEIAILSAIFIWISIFEYKAHPIFADKQHKSVISFGSNISALVILFSWLFLKDNFFLYKEDGFFEWLTAIFYFCAAFILFFISRKKDRIYKIAFIVFALGALLIGMEEISWGQRIFSLNTPDLLNEYNIQQETNLHNIVFLGPTLSIIYRLANLVIGSLLILNHTVRNLFHRHPIFQNFVGLVPSSEIYVVGYLIIVLNFFPILPGELHEQLIALFCFSYALYQYSRWRTNAKKL
ncbi:MAG: hypothetical protein H8D34_34345 [Chloroflexi bacterium]|nr:hypothetical protein [Chloroflexota bacterium]